MLFSYTSSPTGHIIVRVKDRDRWSSDDSLGEIAIPLKGLADGKPYDEWHQLSNEPKKNKNKDPNKPPGELRVKLHFPVAQPEPTETTSSKKSSKSKKETKKASVTDLYTFGKELGRLV